MSAISTRVRRAPHGLPTTHAAQHGVGVIDVPYSTDEIHDFLQGADSDSGLCGRVYCPKCEHHHLATLSTLGWFIYSCRGALLAGQMSDWRKNGAVVDRWGNRNN